MLGIGWPCIPLGTTIMCVGSVLGTQLGARIGASLGDQICLCICAAGYWSPEALPYLEI